MMRVGCAVPTEGGTSVGPIGLGVSPMRWAEGQVWLGHHIMETPSWQTSGFGEPGDDIFTKSGIPEIQFIPHCDIHLNSPERTAYEDVNSGSLAYPTETEDLKAQYRSQSSSSSSSGFRDGRMRNEEEGGSPLFAHEEPRRRHGSRGFDEPTNEQESRGQSENGRAKDPSPHIHQKLREIFAAFLGVTLSYSIVYYIYSSPATGTLSLLSFFTALWCLIDPFATTLGLNGFLEVVLSIIVGIAIGTEIGGFEEFQDNDVLRAFSIGHIPLAVVFALLSFYLAYIEILYPTQKRVSVEMLLRRWSNKRRHKKLFKSRQ